MDTDRVALSYNQIRRLDRDKSVFAGRQREPHHISAAFDLAGHVSVPALRRAVQEVVRRHSSLRTTFHQEGYGRILPPGGVLRVVELDIDLESLTRAEMDELFDLERDLKLRVTLVRTGEAMSRLIITVEHLVCDGQSFDRLLADLACAYNGGDSGASSDFFPWAEAERLALTGSALEERLAFWRTRLDPLEAVPEIRLAGMADPIDGQGGAATLRLDVEPGVVEELRAFCAKNAASLHTGVMAGLQLAVFANTGRTTVGVVGPISLPTDDRERAIGWFSNLAVFRTRVDSGGPVEDLVAGARDAMFDAIDQLIPLPLLVQHLQPGREDALRWRPWLYLDSDWWDEDPLPLAGLKISRVDDTFVPALRPGVGVWANVNGPDPHLFMQWESGAWPEDAARTFLQTFRDCLSLIARSSGATCAELAAAARKQ
ncbi:condensation domain-containing protein [Streptosporangium sp. NPDC006007]|uniref:condensation domain-containing protein n=1 Tax=Streptosporangium sp. NPDC006007 TaxID=3154575 RepID=UPI0033B3A9F6